MAVRVFIFAIFVSGIFFPLSSFSQTPEVITPQKRLQDADTAFRGADYGKLVPLLKDIITEDELPKLADRTTARELLAVGYFFEAQRATDASRRNILLQNVRDVFWQLIQEAPTHRLDAFLFPASVVEIYDDVRTERADEIAILIQKLQGTEKPEQQDVLYVERNVERRIKALNFLPFGVGQFQNGQSVKGTLFLVAQALSLGVNIGAFLAVESLRDRDTGRFSTEPDGGDFSTALLWRNVMYGALAAFAVSYAGSVWDGLRFFEPQRVRIRSLDEPPPELNPDFSGSGNAIKVPLGLSYQWQF